MALHLVAFVALVILTLAEILIDSRREEEIPEPLPPEEVVVELSSEMIMAMRDDAVAPAAAPSPDLAETPPVVTPAEEPPEAEKGFLKTSAEQESEVAPEKPAFIGERDTLAGSEGAVVPDGPPLPSQEGEEQLRNELNLFNSDFADGEEPDRPAATETEAEQPAGLPDASEQEATTPTEETADAQETQESGSPSEPLLDSSNQVAVPAETERADEAQEETLPQADESESAVEAARQGQEGTADKLREKRPDDNGFRTEARRTQIRGSLKRRGRSALDVENTAVGRYRAQVYRVIEREWQQQCVTYRNHILPGSLTLRFFVDEGGDVSGLRYIYEFQTSEIQKGFSVMSVRQAKIPAMPKEVVRELQGEPMECELDLNFRF